MNQLKNQIIRFAFSDQDVSYCPSTQNPPAVLAFADLCPQRKDTWQNWDRSNVWGLYRYMKQTKDQFDEVTSSAKTAIESFVMNEESAAKISKHYEDEITRYYTKAITE